MRPISQSGGLLQIGRHYIHQSPLAEEENGEIENPLADHYLQELQSYQIEKNNPEN